MEDRIWQAMSRAGILRAKPDTWPQGRVYNQQRVRKGDERPLDNPVLRSAMSELIMTPAWHTGDHWGTPLVTFRNVAQWDVPHRVWHLDFPYSWPCGEVRGMNVFMF